MNNSDQNSRLNNSKKNRKPHPRFRKRDLIPSEENCLKCILNLHLQLSNDYYEDENLSVTDQIEALKEDLENLKPVPQLFLQIFEAYTDKKIRLERKLLELIAKEKIRVEESTRLEELNQKPVRKKIQVMGKKSDTAQKVGFFFFNPDNKDGLKLPRIHDDAIIEIFCEEFESIDGTEYSSRYFGDNVVTGANKELDE